MSYKSLCLKCFCESYSYLHPWRFFLRARSLQHWSARAPSAGGGVLIGYLEQRMGKPYKTSLQVNAGLDPLKATLVTLLNALALNPATTCIQNWRACLELVRKMLTRLIASSAVWRVDSWGIFITLKDFLWTQIFRLRGNTFLGEGHAFGMFVLFSI